MSKTNCPNCGAPMDSELIKCPYCGTIYVDFHLISFNVPFYLRLNVGTEEEPQVIVQKVALRSASLTSEPNEVELFYDYDKPMRLFVGPPMHTYELMFTSVYDVDD